MLVLFVGMAISPGFNINTDKLPEDTQQVIAQNIITGAEQTEKYIPYLKGKKVGIG